MSVATHDRRLLRETPYRRDSERRAQERMLEDGVMPKHIPGLIAWFQRKVFLETPDALHSGKVWSDHVSVEESQSGIQPVGSSDTGALAYAADFRRIIESSPSATDNRNPDESGRVAYFRPIAAALSRMHRNGKPLSARILMRVAAANFDWVQVGTTLGYPREIWDMYLKEALICLWMEHRDWARAA